MPPTTTVAAASGTTLARAQARTVELTGFNFSGATVTASAGLTITRLETDVDRLVVHVTVDGAAPLGAGSLTVRTPYGTVDIPVTVAVQTPAITAFAPAKLVGGMVLTITGADLDGGGVGTTEVAVNGTAATVLSVTSTTITARVPVLATTGPVSVTTISGTGTSATDLVVRTLGARRAHVPTADLVAYWTFDVDGQDDADSRDLGFEGGLAATVNGALGRALDFPGNPVRAAARPVNDAPFNFGADDFSIALWARWNTLDDTGAQVLVEKCSAPTDCNGGGWSLIKTASTVRFSPFTGTAPGTIVAGRWYHIAVVRQAGCSASISMGPSRRRRASAR